MIKGFYLIVPQDMIKLFSPEEFDFLISGQSKIDLNDWKSNTEYKGFYTEHHPVIYF